MGCCWVGALTSGMMVMVVGLMLVVMIELKYFGT